MLPKPAWTPRAVFALVVVVAMALLAVPARATVSATGVYASQPNGLTFDYNVLLHNTGTQPIKTFWFSWLPYLSFLPSLPNSDGSPSGWNGTIVEDTYGNSILWSTSGAGIAPGDALSGFTFNTADDPATLAGNDHYFGFYPVTFSYIYPDTVATPASPLPTPPGTLTLSPGVVPEPGMMGLAVCALALLQRRSRSRDRS